jgi:hypothetical protein
MRASLLGTPNKYLQTRNHLRFSASNRGFSTKNRPIFNPPRAKAFCTVLEGSSLAPTGKSQRLFRAPLVQVLDPLSPDLRCGLGCGFLPSYFFKA